MLKVESPPEREEGVKVENVDALIEKRTRETTEIVNCQKVSQCPAGYRKTIR